MTPRQAHALGALIAAGEEMADEMALCADDLDDDDEPHALIEREMVRRWKVALAAYRGEQLDLFAGDQG